MDIAKLIIAIAGIIIIPGGILAGTWGYIKGKVKDNTKWLREHELRIQKVEDCTARIETTIKERIPKNLGERFGKLEQKIEDIKNNKGSRR